MVHDYQRNALPRWQGERFVGDSLPGETRYHDASVVRRPPARIDDVLRDHCNIPTKLYFLAVVGDDGKVHHFSGPETPPLTDAEYQQFFSMQNFAMYAKSRGLAVADSVYEDPAAAQPGSHYSRHPAGPQYNSRRAWDRHHIKTDTSEEDTLQYKTRKRPRGQVYRREADDDQAPVPSTSARRPIKVGDAKELWKFYDQRFRNCQQTACKLIAKAWVKAVEPKKQSNHPYTGSDEKAPEWWPKPWGTTRDEKVRHKEPDHLYKKERVYLLNHILAMIVQPNHKQHADIQKLNLNVRKLEEVTTDALSTFFSDKENNNNAKKKPYLKEIFKVARIQERYYNGEIDADYTIHVMPDDKIPENYQSDNEDSATREEDDNVPTSIPSSISPHKTTAPHGLIPTSSIEHSPAGQLHGGPFVNDLPVRPAQYAQSLISTGMVDEQHHYVEGSGMAPTGLQSHSGMAMTDILAASHDGSRRPSYFNSSPTEYSTAPNSNMYTANNWQTTSTASSTAPMYANTFAPQQSHHAALPAPGGFVQQQPVTVAQGPSYLGSSYDGLQRFETASEGMYRSAAGPSVPGAQSPGYPTYVHHDTRPLPGAAFKLDPLGRNTLH